MADRELRLDGPVVIGQCDTDPGDMGEPRVFESDGVTYVCVPSFNLWPKDDGADAWSERRKPDDPFPVPTVSELDTILRRSLPPEVVFAMAPTGDPFTRWARRLLGVRQEPAIDVELEAALERERDLRQALLEGSYFHVTHDGMVRHPDTCNDCRAAGRDHHVAATPGSE